MTPDFVATNPPRTARRSNPTTQRVGAPETAMIVTTDALIIKTVPISGCKRIRSIGSAAIASALSTSLFDGSSELCVRSESNIDIPIMMEIFAISAG